MAKGRNKGANANVIINLRRAPITRAQEAAWRTLWVRLLREIPGTAKSLEVNTARIPECSHQYLHGEAGETLAKRPEAEDA